MKPLSVPVRPVAASDANARGRRNDTANIAKIEQLSSTINDSEKLLRDIYCHLSAAKVVDLSERKPDKRYLTELSAASRLKMQFEKVTSLMMLCVCLLNDGDLVVQLKREKGSLVTEDCLFNKIWTAPGHREARSGDADKVGCVSFQATADGEQTVFVASSRLTVARLHNIFSY